MIRIAALNKKFKHRVGLTVTSERRRHLANVIAIAKAFAN